jgi:hypothetical protein
MSTGSDVRWRRVTSSKVGSILGELGRRRTPDSDRKCHVDIPRDCPATGIFDCLRDTARRDGRLDRIDAYWSDTEQSDPGSIQAAHTLAAGVGMAEIPRGRHTAESCWFLLEALVCVILLTIEATGQRGPQLKAW